MMIKMLLLSAGLSCVLFSTMALEQDVVFSAPFSKDLSAETAAGKVLPISGKGEIIRIQNVDGVKIAGDDASVLLYSGESILPDDEGAIEFKYYPLLKEAVAACGGKDVFATLVSIKSSLPPDYTGLSIGINAKDNGNKFYPWVIAAGKEGSQIFRQADIGNSKWYKFTICWTRQRVLFYLDDRLFGSMKRPPVLFGDKYIGIGGYGIAKGYGVIADFKIYRKPLKIGETDTVSFIFPGRKGKAELIPNSSIPIKANIFAAKVVTDAPAILHISSGIFRVAPGQGYVVNFSDRPVRYLSADAKGVLSIELEREDNCSSFTIIPCDTRNLLDGVEWYGQSSTAPKFTLEWGHESGRTDAGMPAAQSNVGTYSRDPAVSRSGKPGFKIEKTAQSGEVSWKSRPVRVKAGQEYLFTGWYHLTEPNFGASGMCRIILPATGDKPEKMFDPVALNPLIAPLYGTQWRYVQIMFKVPDGYDQLYALLSLRGAPQVIWWDDLSLRPAPAPNSFLPRPPTAEESSPTIPIEEVRRLWQTRAPVKVDVKNSGNFPVLYVNDKPVPSLAYNNFTIKTEESEYKTTLKAGIRWHYIWLTPRYTSDKDWWQGKGKYDFSEVRKSIELALSYSPDTVIMLNVRITPDYRAWGDEHPDAVWRDHDGRKVAGTKVHVTKPDKLGNGPYDRWACSYSAEEFRSTVAEALRDLIKHINSFDCGKAVAGVNLWCGTDSQWFPHVQYQGFDFSPGAEKDFRIFLREIYGSDVNRLRQAWQNPEITFETAKLAPFELRTKGWFLDPKKGTDRWIIDSNRHNDIGAMKSANYFGKVVKEEFGRNIFINIYSPDIIQGYSGRSNQKLLFEDKYIDGFISVPDYGVWRLPGRTGNYSSVAGSLGLHGKILLSELDYRTHTSWKPADAATQIMIQGGVNDENEFINQGRRDLGMLAAQGQGGWFLGLSRNMFDSTKYVEAVNELAAAMELAAKNPMPEDRGQIGVFIDDELRNYAAYGFSQNFNNLSVGLARLTLSRSGVSWDAYNLADLTNPKRAKYKVNLFLAAPTISAARIEWVKQNLQKDGNIVIFVSAAGIASDKGTFEDNIYQLTGMNVKYVPETSSHFRIRPLFGVNDELAAGLKDNVLTESMQPLFYIDDKSAIAFGEITGTGKTGWAVKRFKDWTSIYIAIPGAFTPELIRNIVREAGIEPIGPCNDVTYSGNGFITIHALSNGNKILRLPDKCDLLDLASGKSAGRNIDTISCQMQAGETRWFRKSISQ
jgi:hypothetical protein